MQVIETSQLTREQWLELRRHSIGASDAPIIAGLSRYKSRFALWGEKTGRWDPEEAGEQAWFGTQLERVILDRIRILGLAKIGDIQVMVRDVRHPWLTATLDAVDDDGDIWEFKAAGIGTAKGLENGDASTLPPAWVCQAHHQMFVAGKRECRFAVFAGHRLKLLTFTVEFDDVLWDSLFELEREFWARVQSGEPPLEFDAEDDGWLRKLFDRVDGEHLVISDPTNIEIARELVEAAEQRKYAESVEKKAKAALLYAMGNASTAECGPYRLTRKEIRCKAYEVKASSYIQFTYKNGDDE